MKRIRHILLAATAFVLLAGCVYDDYADVADPADEQLFVTLLLHVGTVVPTRGADTPSAELMHSLRIVLVDADKNSVEYNTLIDQNNSDLFGSGDNGVDELDYSKFRIIRTVPGRKKIFLIANEESTRSVNGVAGQSLTDLLDSKPAGASDFETLVNGIWFTPDFDNRLILSANYDFEIGQSSLGGEVRKEFWLVHAATKFDFRFENHCPNTILIDELNLSQLAGTSGTGDMYLLANLATSERDKTYEGTSYYWIEWLRRVCDETTANPEDPDNTNINERYGWISDYVLPAGVDHTVVDIKDRVGESADAFWEIATGESLSLNNIYCSESKYAAGGADQEYAFSVKLINTEALVGDDDREREFLDNRLDHVKALFRNTHVKITVSVKQDLELELRIGVCPWVEQEIEIPPFD